MVAGFQGQIFRERARYNMLFCLLQKNQALEVIFAKSIFFFFFAPNAVLFIYFLNFILFLNFT